MKLSFQRIALSTFEARGHEMSVSTVRIREGNTFTWQTAILCKGSVSDPFRSTSKDAALIAHDKIVGYVRGWENDAFSRYSDFVKSALADVAPEHRDAIAPKSEPRLAQVVRIPCQPQLRLVGSALASVPQMDGRIGDTKPAPGMPEAS